MRVALAKPTAAAIFLVVNGFILIGAERLRRRPAVQALAGDQGPEGRTMESLTYGRPPASA